MGGGIDGLYALAELRKIKADLKVIIYSMFSDALTIRKCITANVQAYVTKSSSIEDLYRGIKTALFGGSYFCREASIVLSKAANLGSEDSAKEDIFKLYKTLTPKEKEIFLLCAKGFSTAKIAEQTNKKESTVKNQRTAIYQKLGCTDRYELNQAAKDLGLV